MSYGYGPQTPRSEVGIFAAHGVQVTSARFVCWNQTYPIANITSVTPFTEHPSKNGEQMGGLFAVLLILTGSGCGWCGRVTDAPGLTGSGVTLIVFAVVTIAYCIYSARGKRPRHGVTITTAGMNVRAITSEDPQFVSAVVGALDHAISMR